MTDETVKKTVIYVNFLGALHCSFNLTRMYTGTLHKACREGVDIEKAVNPFGLMAFNLLEVISSKINLEQGYYNLFFYQTRLFAIFNKPPRISLLAIFIFPSSLTRGISDTLKPSLALAMNSKQG